MDNGWMLVALIAGIVICSSYFLSSAESAIPPTRAFSRLVTENTTLIADSYNDFAKLSGVHDLHVTEPKPANPLRSTVGGTGL